MSELLESVKIARADLAGVTGLTGEPFKMKLGPNEVAILLAFYWNVIGTPAVGTNIAYVGLWKKTDTNPPTIMVEHTDLIWGVRCQILHVAETVRASWNEMVTLPHGIVLVRAPRLAALADTLTALTVQMRLFYRLKEVSDKQLAELMVKDHA